MVRVDEKIFNSTIEVEILETSKVIKRFNELKDKGKKVTAVTYDVLDQNSLI